MRLNRRGIPVVHSLQANGEVVNCRAVPSFSLYAFMSNRDKFTFTFTIDNSQNQKKVLRCPLLIYLGYFKCCACVPLVKRVGFVVRQQDVCYEYKHSEHITASFVPPKLVGYLRTFLLQFYWFLRVVMTFGIIQSLAFVHHPSLRYNVSGTLRSPYSGNLDSLRISEQLLFIGLS